MKFTEKVKIWEDGADSFTTEERIFEINITEEWEVTKPQPQKYRFEHGSLFEYQPDMQAYLHVGKGRNRSQAIKAYEASL